MGLRVEGRRRAYTPKDTDKVRCETHDITVPWGDLDRIQRLAVEEGIDTSDDLECLLAPSRRKQGGKP